MTASALVLILLAGLVAAASPGPATLAILGTSMERGRRSGLALALGVATGALVWSVAAALGLSTVMAANARAVEVLRVAGALYLLWLALRSARSALRPGAPRPRTVGAPSLRAAWLRGLALHLPNPKPIFFFGSLYAVGLPEGTGPGGLALVVAALAMQNTPIFMGYAALFSTRGAVASYVRLRRPLDALFALLFGAAGLRLLTARTP